MEAGTAGQNYAKMKFDFADGNMTVSSDSKTVSTKSFSKVTPDTDVAAVVSSYEELIDPISQTVVGERDGYFRRYYTSSYPDNGSLGNFCTKAMMYYANTVCEDKTVIGAFHNVKGVRADWLSSGKNANGNFNITIGDLYSVFPFDNELQVVSIPGSYIKSLYNNTSYYYTSSSIYEENDVLYYGNGQVIEDTTKYRVITIDFLITGGGLLSNNGEEGERLKGETAYARDAITYFAQDAGVIKTADYPFQGY